jgi:hypothetical protein
MSTGDGRRDDKHLETLERWKRLELEAAQAEHRVRQAAEAEKRSQHERVQGVIDDAQQFARSQCESGARLSPQALLLAARFSQAQERALAQAQQVLRESQEAELAARQEVISRFGHLAGIEKLRERRRERAAREELQQQQKGMDEHALLKLSIEIAADDKNS